LGARLYTCMSPTANELVGIERVGARMSDPVRLFLCGDVMTGRGIDQILQQPSPPELHEPWVCDARDYVDLAERANGPIPRRVDAAYIWGDALTELTRVAPVARIINLETSITTSDSYWPGKPIHYRMHPANIDCLTVARIDVCTLANNHILDFGYAGLVETVDTLRDAGVSTAGAGRDLREAERPAIVELSPMHRVVVFSLGSATSGVPDLWSAMDERSGVDFLPDLSDRTADRLLERVARVARSRDVVIASIHWGTNWGYDVPRSFVHFAHRLLDGGVALLHGHSSHHPRPIEVYKRKLVLYGCGDFLSDYEGISGYEAYRGDLALMYFPTLDLETGELVSLGMTPIRVRRLQATLAAESEAAWLRDTLTRASERFGARIESVAGDRPDGPRLVLAPTR
jgi:poly-gamma-glutamate capsule biosynthesis protein CapA/YwtB (metallophosphatase superfamily)